MLYASRIAKVRKPLFVPNLYQLQTCAMSHYRFFSLHFMIIDAQRFKEEFERCQQQLLNREDSLTTEMKQLTVEEEDKVKEVVDKD